MNAQQTVESTAYWVQVTGSLCFLFPGIFLVACNWLLVIIYWVKGRCSSLAPPIGGFCMFIGLLCFPSTFLKSVSWIGLLVDPGTTVLVIAVLKYWRGRADKDRAH